jgi:hypothetical protein
MGLAFQAELAEALFWRQCENLSEIDLALLTGSLRWSWMPPCHALGGKALSQLTVDPILGGRPIVGRGPGQYAKCLWAAILVGVGQS